MKKYWYVIKDHTADDFSNLFKPAISYKKFYDHESVAEDIAEQYYDDDPGDPEDVNLTIGVKDESSEVRWFKCHAEIRVHFYAEEILNHEEKSQLEGERDE